MRDGRVITRTQVVKELGDILWCLAVRDWLNDEEWPYEHFMENGDAKAENAELPIVFIEGLWGYSKSEVTDILGAASYLSGSEDRTSRFHRVCRYLGIRMEEVAQTNLEKLADRKARNVIHGEGDER